MTVTESRRPAGLTNGYSRVTPIRFLCSVRRLQAPLQATSSGLSSGNCLKADWGFDIVFRDPSRSRSALCHAKADAASRARGVPQARTGGIVSACLLCLCNMPLLDAPQLLQAATAGSARCGRAGISSLALISVYGTSGSSMSMAISCGHIALRERRVSRRSPSGKKHTRSVVRCFVLVRCADEDSDACDGHLDVVQAQPVGCDRAVVDQVIP